MRQPPVEGTEGAREQRAERDSGAHERSPHPHRLDPRRADGIRADQEPEAGGQDRRTRGALAGPGEGEAEGAREAGVLARQRYQESPPRDEYVLTDNGKALWPTLRSLGLWGREHIEGTVPMRYFFHAMCDTELGVYGQCQACGNIGVRLEDVEMRPAAGLDTDADDPDDPVSRALVAPRRLLQLLDTDRV
ncbi:winged helix-turn-helix transcriptional regulator [Streptomyces sp. NPDC002911]